MCGGASARVCRQTMHRRWQNVELLFSNGLYKDCENVLRMRNEVDTGVDGELQNFNLEILQCLRLRHSLAKVCSSAFSYVQQNWGRFPNAVRQREVVGVHACYISQRECLLDPTLILGRSELRRMATQLKQYVSSALECQGLNYIDELRLSVPRNFLLALEVSDEIDHSELAVREMDNAEGFLIHYFKALSHYLEGDFDACSARASKSVLMCPENSFPLCLLFRAILDARNFSGAREAIALHRTSLQLCGTYRTFSFIASLLVYASDYHQATDMLKFAMKLGAVGGLVIYVNTAAIFNLRGNLVACAEVISQAKKDAIRRVQSSETMSFFQGTDLDVQYLSFSMGMYFQAKHAAAAKNFDQALRLCGLASLCLQRAIRSYPEMATLTEKITNLKATTLMDCNRIDEAMNEVAPLVEDNVYSTVLYAEGLLRQGHAIKSLVYLRSALKNACSDVDTAHLRNNIGIVLAILQRENSRSEIQHALETTCPLSVHVERNYHAVLALAGGEVRQAINTN